jgi:hypothetical protein
MVTPINFANDLKILESEQVPAVQKALSLTAIHLSLDAQMQRAAREKKSSSSKDLKLDLKLDLDLDKKIDLKLKL